MFASDFYFNGNCASDFGLIIGGIDGENLSVSGGELSVISTSTPNSDKHSFIASNFESVLTYTVSVVSNPCENQDDLFIDANRESQIAKWLLQRRGYKELRFDQDDYENICYFATVTSLVPQQILGKTIGFDITFECNNSYGYSLPIIKEFTCDSETPNSFNVYCDVDNYIIPKVTIKDCSGDFTIKNTSDLYQTNPVAFTNIDDDIEMDGENCIISDNVNPNDFNYIFLRLVDGINTITTTSTSEIIIRLEYREPRRILI